MQTTRILGIGAVILALGGLSAVQMHSLRDTRARVATLESRIAELVSASPQLEQRGTSATVDLRQRLADLESIVAGRGSKPSAEPRRAPPPNLAELRRKLLDPALSDKDKLEALRLLRRNKGLDDEAVAGAINLLQSSAEAAVRREVLQQLEGLTNAALRQPLLDIAAGSDPRVREEAVENLRQFAADPEVEKQLWALAHNDPDADVRQKAEEALRRAPMTPDRAARLQEVASNSEASLDDRLTALRALHRGGVNVADVSAVLADLAQNTQDPVARAKVFRALDGVNDPRLLLPLVNALQDPSPVVRQEAAETIGRFTSDPTVRQWLEYVAQSDADSEVRREAFQALKKIPKVRP